MIISKSIIKSREEVVDIVCNQCGKSCKTEQGFEVAELNATWGYGSKHHDTEQYQIHLCEVCFDLLLAGLGDPGLVATGIL